VDPLLEKVRDLAIQEIDRRSDVARVLQSGRWPAVIINSWLWLPRDIVAGSLRLQDDEGRDVFRFLGDAFRGQLDRLREFAARERVHSIDYAVEFSPHYSRGGPSRGIFRIVVEPDLERAHLTNLPLPVIAKPRIVEKIAPSADERARWVEVESALRRERETVQAAREHAEKARQKWSERQFPILVERMIAEGLSCTHCRRRSNDFLVRKPTLVCRNCGKSHWPEDISTELPPSLPDPVPSPDVAL